MKIINFPDRESHTEKCEVEISNLPSPNVGDKVRVFDGSYNFDAYTGKQYSGIDPLFKKEATVIETNCDQWIRKHSGRVVQCDVKIKFDSGEEVYVHRRMLDQNSYEETNLRLGVLLTLMDVSQTIQ